MTHKYSYGVSVSQKGLMKLNNEESTKFEYTDDSHSVPKFAVDVNANLEFTVYVYNWPIPDDHSSF